MQVAQLIHQLGWRAIVAAGLAWGLAVLSLAFFCSRPAACGGLRHSEDSCLRDPVRGVGINHAAIDRDVVQAGKYTSSKSRPISPQIPRPARRLHLADQVSRLTILRQLSLNALGIKATDDHHEADSLVEDAIHFGLVHAAQLLQPGENLRYRPAPRFKKTRRSGGSTRGTLSTSPPP